MVRFLKLSTHKLKSEFLANKNDGETIKSIKNLIDIKFLSIFLNIINNGY